MDSAWALVWVTVALVAATLLAGVRRTPQSRVQYLQTSVQRLVTVPLGTVVSVKILGREVKNAFAFEMRIVNSGRRSLPKESWETPLFIEVAEGSQILTVDQIGATPMGLRANYTIKDNRVEVEPLLLNRGDALSFQLVCEGTGVNSVAHARIKDVSSVKRRGVPYPPGNGPDGSMLTGNKVISYGIIPLFGLVVAVLLVIGAASNHPMILTSWITAAVWFVLFAVVYPVFMWRALKTSALWRPAERISPK